jgi:dihydropyrimidinase
MSASYDYDLVILNCVLVTESETTESDIGIKDERIKVVEAKGKLSGAKAQRIIDAQGGYVTVR